MKFGDIYLLNDTLVIVVYTPGERFFGDYSDYVRVSTFEQYSNRLDSFMAYIIYTNLIHKDKLTKL